MGHDDNHEIESQYGVRLTVRIRTRGCHRHSPPCPIHETCTRLVAIWVRGFFDGTCVWNTVLDGSDSLKYLWVMRTGKFDPATLLVGTLANVERNGGTVQTCWQCHNKLWCYLSAKKRVSTPKSELRSLSEFGSFSYLVLVLVCDTNFERHVMAYLGVKWFIGW